MSKPSNVMNNLLTHLNDKGFEADAVEIGKLKEKLDIDVSKLQTIVREIHVRSGYKPIGTDDRPIEHSNFNAHVNYNFRALSPEAVRREQEMNSANRLKVISALHFVTKESKQINDALKNQGYELLTEKEIKKLNLV
jgi:hypothetical protein